MICSMTGFGQACIEADGVIYTVEIRSVNNRYLKTQFRLPDIMAFLEGEIEKLHRTLIQRGTISYSLRMKNVSGQALFDVDEHTLATYVQRLKGLLADDDTHSRLDLGSMLTLPGIIQPAIPDEAQTERMRQAVLSLTQEALNHLNESRAQEGEVVKKPICWPTVTGSPKNSASSPAAWIRFWPSIISDSKIASKTCWPRPSCLSTKTCWLAKSRSMPNAATWPRKFPG